MRLATALLLEAERRALWPRGAADDASLPPADAFRLVRDMPYARAADVRPETVIRAWRGTCSGKHSLLKAVFAELGIASQLMACTHRFSHEDSERVPAALRPLLHDGDFVDVHNYLVVQSPEGEMLVDETWPAAARAFGLPVNEEFVWGRDMRLACVPLAVFAVPDGADLQRFKNQLLRDHFTATDLARREVIIEAVIAALGSG
jgi:hypothetical protein